MLKTRAVNLTRLALVIGVIITYILSIYFEHKLDNLPTEAKQYSNIALETRSGFDLSFAIARILFVSGVISGIVGGILIIARKKFGIILFLAAPAIIAVAKYLIDFHSSYPLLENTNSTFFLSIASALWGAIIFNEIDSNKNAK